MKKTYQERMKNLEVTVSELREYKIEKRGDRSSRKGRREMEKKIVQKNQIERGDRDRLNKIEKDEEELKTFNLVVFRKKSISCTTHKKLEMLVAKSQVQQQAEKDR